MSLSPQDKKAAVAAFKERKSFAGVFALRCAATGEIWVGMAQNLDTIWTRLSFTLRQGALANRALQRAWTEHGQESFSFEPLEKLDEETHGFARDGALRERLAYWRATLPAGNV